MNHAEEWRKANNLKVFIDEIELSYGDFISGSKIANWISWARNMYKTINPISSNVDHFLDHYDYEKSKIMKRGLPN